MSKLATQHAAVNLGQGFPDSEGPETMKQIATKALYEQSNQYPSLLGVPELRQAVARHSSEQQQLPCDWATETLVTVGATEGLAAAFMGLCNPGDEVIVFEPLYDSYAGMAQQVSALCTRPHSMIDSTSSCFLGSRAQQGVNVPHHILHTSTLLGIEHVDMTAT